MFDYDELRKHLLTFKDVKYRDFTKKIVDTKYEMIGIRIPILRKIAKDIVKTDYIDYLDNFNYKYFEEIFIYGFVLGHIKEKNLFKKYLNRYIKMIDNWSLCDSAVASFKIFKTNKFNMYDVVDKLINSKKTFEIRAGIVILLDYYIEDSYLNDIFKYANTLRSSEYYVNMALAWLLSICYIKYPEETYKFLLDNNLDKFTFNMTISKICDSYRVDKKDKDKLKKLKIKE